MACWGLAEQSAATKFEQSHEICKLDALSSPPVPIEDTPQSRGPMIGIPGSSSDGSIVWKREQTDALLEVIGQFPRGDVNAYDVKMQCEMLLTTVTVCGNTARKWFGLLLFFSRLHAPDDWSKTVIDKLFEMYKEPRFASAEEAETNRRVVQAYADIARIREDSRKKMKELAIEINKIGQGMFGKMVAFFTGYSG
jgi:hypothetical protein